MAQSVVAMPVPLRKGRKQADASIPSRPCGSNRDRQPAQDQQCAAGRRGHRKQFVAGKLPQRSGRRRTGLPQRRSPRPPTFRCRNEGCRVRPALRPRARRVHGRAASKMPMPDVAASGRCALAAARTTPSAPMIAARITRMRNWRDPVIGRAPQAGASSRRAVPAFRRRCATMSRAHRGRQRDVGIAPRWCWRGFPRARRA